MIDDEILCLQQESLLLEDNILILYIYVCNQVSQNIEIVLVNLCD